jgi:hypothetical protein
VGGGSYDRDVYPSSRSSGGFAFSDASARAVGSSYASSDLLPKNRVLSCDHKNPVVINLDVTGSMGNWARTIYDKMPMFFGQIVQQGYLPDLSISFAANGDAYSDRYPIQVCDFAEGTALDADLAKIFIEGNGGGNHHESYELMAWLYANKCKIPKDAVPFFFFLADEGVYDTVDSDQVQSLFGVSVSGQVTAKAVFAKLLKKFKGNVFLVHKNYYDDANSPTNKEIVAQWEDLIGSDHVLVLQDPKAVVDVMLGAIAVSSGTRDLSEYATDMEERGQDAKRVKQVTATLESVKTNPLVVDTTDLLPDGPALKRAAGTKKI